MELDKNARLDLQGLINWYQGESDRSKLKLEVLAEELRKTLNPDEAIELFLQIDTWQQRLLNSEDEILALTKLD